MLTDPQNDVPCRGCETEGPPARLDDEGLCSGCRTPAGRLLTELSARGVKGVTDGDGWISVGGVTVTADDPDGWVITSAEGSEVTAADAIAAIVQAPGLRAEIAILTSQCDGSFAFVTAIEAALDAAGVRSDIDERYMQQVSEDCYEPAGEYRQADPLERVGFLVSERDTLAARVAELEAHNGRMVEHALLLADKFDAQASALPLSEAKVDCSAAASALRGFAWGSP